MKISLFFAIVCVAACSAQAIEKVRYDNYKVYKVIPETEEGLQRIRDVEEHMERLDFWKGPTKVGRAVDVMVPPDRDMSFVRFLDGPGLSIETMIPNVQDSIDREAAEMNTAGLLPFDPANFDFNKYHPYDEIHQWMEYFASSHPEVSMVPVTTTYEKKTVYGLKIAKSKFARNYAYFQGGIHAREWISPATVINLINMFISNYDKDSTIKDMLDNFVWIIVPVYNIDGYEYSHGPDRMWRKNRNPNTGGCVGVDLNRNFEYEWGDAGKKECGETYQGTRAMSEPENQGLKNFLENLGSDNLKLFIDFHSYGQMWFHPWGYTEERNTRNDDREDQYSLAVEVEKSIRSVYGTRYTIGESGPDMYAATGASEDFGYGTLGAKYSYVVELRDKGRYGFELPAAQIQPTAEEIYAAMKTVGQRLITEYA